MDSRRTEVERRSRAHVAAIIPQFKSLPGDPLFRSNVLNVMNIMKRDSPVVTSVMREALQDMERPTIQDGFEGSGQDSSFAKGEHSENARL